MKNTFHVGNMIKKTFPHFYFGVCVSHSDAVALTANALQCSRSYVRKIAADLIKENILIGATGRRNRRLTKNYLSFDEFKSLYKI